MHFPRAQDADVRAGETPFVQRPGDVGRGEIADRDVVEACGFESRRDHAVEDLVETERRRRECPALRR